LKRKVIAGLVLGVVALALVLALVVKPGNMRATGTGAGGQVGVIYIEGPIYSGQRTGGLFGYPGSAEGIAARLRQAAKDPQLKAVVIRLNSPGGTAAAAQEISSEVQKLKQTGKKVVASMGDTAASGAYWIAAGTDLIVANSGTMTGSIGVIMELVNTEGLYDKLGLDTETFKSGPYKDMGSPSRPVTPGERAIFQSMIDDIYNQFVEIVARGRNMEVEEVKKIADGRVLTGRQAKETGLVDRLGGLHDAVLLAGELAGIPGEPQVVELGPKSIWQELFVTAGGSVFQGLSRSFVPILPGQREGYYFYFQ